jgi:hypothetical protein
MEHGEMKCYFTAEVINARRVANNSRWLHFVRTESGLVGVRKQSENSRPTNRRYRRSYCTKHGVRSSAHSSFCVNDDTHMLHMYMNLWNCTYIHACIHIDLMPITCEQFLDNEVESGHAFAAV